MFTKNNDFKNNLIKILLIPLMIVFLLVATLQTTFAIDLPTNSISDFAESLESSLVQDAFYESIGYDFSVESVVNTYDVSSNNLTHYYYTDVVVKNVGSTSAYLNIILNDITKFNSSIIYINNTNYTLNKTSHSNFSIYSWLRISKNDVRSAIASFQFDLRNELISDSSGFLSFVRDYLDVDNYDAVAINETFTLRFYMRLELIGGPVYDLDVNSFQFRYINMSQTDLLTSYYDFLDINDIYNEGFDAGFASGYQQGYDTGLTDAISISDYESAFNWGVQVGYNQAVNELGSYDAGYSDGVADGLADGLAEGYNSGYSVGYSIGKTDGYNEGINDSVSQGWLLSIFNLFGTVLAIELLPNITIGFLVGLPVILGLVFFIIKVARGGD